MAEAFGGGRGGVSGERPAETHRRGVAGEVSSGKSLVAEARCINVQPEGVCCLTETPCPYVKQTCAAAAGTRTCGRAAGGDGWRACPEARVGLRVHLAPDEFLILATPDGRPAAGRFPLRRCRVTRVEEAAGVHVSSLLTSLGDAALMDATELDPGTVLLTTRDGLTSLLWKSGKFLPG